MKELILILFSLTCFLSLLNQDKCNVNQKMGDLVVATVYNAVPKQTNSDPGNTASMFALDLENPYKHKIIAVSRDLLVKYPMGTYVRISGTRYDGIYQVQDKMNKRWHRRIDILINVGMPLGKWDKVKITKVYED